MVHCVPNEVDIVCARKRGECGIGATASVCVLTATPLALDAAVTVSHCVDDDSCNGEAR